ncbi:alpha/beta fold hydrolase [Devosia ginsengisoli]|nr:alpha/beta fold hydrolase [Devosia ginsengisoli]
MKSTKILGAAGLAILLSSTAAFAAGEAGPLHLRGLGNFYVGAVVSEPDAEGNVSVTNQMYVGYALPAEAKHDIPLILVHGGGGQASDWFSTPDGRDGWRNYFVNAGFDTYWVDRPGYGRSPTSASYGDGQIASANSGIIARLSASDNFPGGEVTPTSEGVIGWLKGSSSTPYAGNEIAAKDLSELLDKVGPAILVLHSAGGGSGFWAADLNPEKVAGIIAIEASGSDGLSQAQSLTFDPPLTADFVPVEGADGCKLQPEGAVSTLTNLAGIPVTLVSTPNSFLGAPQVCALASLQQAGVTAELVKMEDVGAPGTGHFLMAETNNADSAKAIIDIAEGMLAE